MRYKGEPDNDVDLYACRDILSACTIVINSQAHVTLLVRACLGEQQDNLNQTKHKLFERKTCCFFTVCSSNDTYTL